MECLLCLELNKDIEECIKTNSSTWNELDIQSVIEKHLWPMFLLKSGSQWLCISCWHILRDFHKFYMRIENAHECLMKIEPDQHITHLTESSNKSKDFLAENLLEPEIIIDHNIPNVKQENEESDIEHGNDEDNIPLIRMRQSVDYTCNHCETENEDLTEDPLVKGIKSKSKVGKRGRIRRSSVKTAVKIQPKTKTCLEKTTTNIAEDSKDIKAAGSLLLANTDSITFGRNYHQSKINCREYDAFTAKNFKILCDICHEASETFSNLQKHFNDKHDVRGYAVCCEQKYFRHSLLVDHLCCHLNPEYFKCDLCSEVSTLRKSYKAHMKSHEEKPHVCDVCNKQFLRRDLLDNHKLIHLSNEEKKFLCEVCDKFFASEPMLMNHQKVVHLKKYVKLCDICGESKRNVESLRRHMIKHEGVVAPPPLSCEVCGRLVANKRNLKIHMNSQHPVEKRDFICPVCQKKSPNAKALRQHVRVNHETGYIHKCSICEKAFKRRENLKSHMNIHTGTDLFECPWCTKTFNANSSMHLHRKTAHPQEWEEERRRKYSGNLPPNFKPPPTKESINNFSLQYHF